MSLNRPKCDKQHQSKETHNKLHESKINSNKLLSERSHFNCHSRVLLIPNPKINTGAQTAVIKTKQNKLFNKP